MERVGHINIQEYLKTHRLFYLVLYPRYIGLRLENIRIEPTIIPTETDKWFGRLGSYHQRRRPRRSRMTVHILGQPVKLFLGMFVEPGVDSLSAPYVKAESLL